MNPHPAVTIVTALHNAEAFIADTIESVSSQIFADWEHLIVDDASTDAGPAIVRRYMDSDERIRLIPLSQNSGPAVARNAAIRESSGRYIAFLDSDDQWLPEKLERQISFMQQTKSPFTYSWFEEVLEDGQVTGRVRRPPDRLTYHELLKENRIGCLTAVYDTEVLGRRLMPLIRKRQDFGLWLSILRDIPEARCVPEVLARYRLRPASVSGNKVDLVRYNWQLFRHVEGLSFAASARALGSNVVRKIRGV